VSKIVGVWNRIETILVGVLAGAAVAVAFYGVIMRYIFRAPPHWTEEICIYLIVWAVFLVASTLAEEKGHVAATLLLERFPLKVRRILNVLNGILALGFCWIVSWYGFLIVLKAFASDHRSPTALRFPLWIAYLSVAAGCSLVGIRYGMRIYRLLFKFQVAEIMETHEMSREEIHP
jgi:C4-dicarboxylate transporter, DctQ subunit